MHAVTKVADLTKFRQTKYMFMDLTILAHYSQIRQSAISLAELTSLTSFSQIRRSEISLADLTIFYRIFPIFVTACVSRHISKR